MRIVFLFVVYILMVVFLSPVLVILRILRRKDTILSLSRWIFRVSRSVLGVRVETVGLERFEDGGPFIFMANHLSLLDGPILFMVLPGPVRVILKKSLFRIPIVGWLMSYPGFVPVDRKGVNSGRVSIEKAAERIRENGYSFLIFPEGTRSLDGRLQKFRRGGFFLAASTATPIVPVTVRGTFELMPKGSRRIKRGTVRIAFHSPVAVGKDAIQDLSPLMDNVRAAISSGLPG